MLLLYLRDWPFKQVVFLAAPCWVMSQCLFCLWQHWLVMCGQKHNIPKSFEFFWEFSWCNKFALHTKFASKFTFLCWSYFPWCEILHAMLSPSHMVTAQLQTGISIDFNPQMPHGLNATARWFCICLSRQLHPIKLSLVCISAFIKMFLSTSFVYVLSAVLGRFSYFSWTSASRQIWRGRTALAASLCVLVKGHCVHNAGVVEYQGL